ncbi:MAG: hypothetical protein JW915_16680 [Chitinispirillaceae bacterium]|nr:hypothetical protein [Chitinispirillaceae bacterium]
MKWIMYFDAGVFWLLVIGFPASFRGNEKIVYGDGILIENITSQKNYSHSDIQIHKSVDGSYREDQLFVEPKVKSDVCTYFCCTGRGVDNSPVERRYSGTLLLLYY